LLTFVIVKKKEVLVDYAEWPLEGSLLLKFTCIQNLTQNSSLSAIDHLLLLLDKTNLQ